MTWSPTSGYRSYWNNQAVERSKPWWIEHADDPKLLTFLRSETNLERCFRDALSFAEERFGPIRGTVLDLGAGVCWTSAILSRLPLVERIHAVEFSSHRLFQIAPLVFRQYEANKNKIDRHCEDMQLLGYESASVDLVLFCQALYMTGRPGELLRDVFRVLKAGGLVMVCCERISESPGWSVHVRRSIRAILHSPHEVLTKGFKAAVVDRSGRYDYLDSDYEAFLTAAGFEFHLQRMDYPIFKSSLVRAGNYFGVKRGLP